MKNLFRMAALGVAVLLGSSFAVAHDWDRDDDDYRYSRDYRYGDFRRGMDIARSFGYQDGARVAQEDNWRGKPFNPNPRGPYAWADHGYRRGFGSVREYREHYARAYRNAYVSNRRGYQGNDGYWYRR
jgi:hypothetical protein